MATKKLNPSGSIEKKDILAFCNAARWDRWSPSATLSQLELFCRALEADKINVGHVLSILVDAEKFPDK